jgi:hypothetical protein
MYEGMVLMGGVIVRRPACLLSIVVEPEDMSIPYAIVSPPPIRGGSAAPDDPAWDRHEHECPQLGGHLWQHEAGDCEEGDRLTCPEHDDEPDPASRRYIDYRDALRANQARALGAGSDGE